MKLFIIATNVHVGGGRTLLEALLASLGNRYQGALFVDSRLDPVLPPEFGKYSIRPNIKDRLKSEYTLRRLVKKDDLVICLGNLPPLFKLKGRVFVFIQNRYLLERRQMRRLGLLVRCRIMLERAWLRLRKGNADRFIVQTPSMQRLMKEQIGRKALMLPFHATAGEYARQSQKTRTGRNRAWDFLYVASGDPQKNQRRLIQAWIALAGEGLRPSLCLTIDKEKYAGLCCWIEAQTARYGLRVGNAGHRSYAGISRLYAASGALIYPSLLETIGLPLIEARCAGLPIVASELDYVRDVVDPEQTFDPRSAVSMARAVKRYLEKGEKRLPLLKPEKFLTEIIRRS